MSGQEVEGLELCVVCGDRASGRHYGAISCEGCKGFFKRSIRKQMGYHCQSNNDCVVTKHERNRCQSCRLQKCRDSGMRSDSVQHERKPFTGRSKRLETRDRRLLNQQASYSKLLSLAGQGPSVQINLREEPSDACGAAVSPAAPALNFALAAAVALNKGNPASPYLNPGNPGEMEIACRQHLMLQTHIAKNLFNMGQFDALNEYSFIQSAYGASPPEVMLHNETQQTYGEEESILSRAESLQLPLIVPGPVPPHLRLHAICEAGARLLAATARWMQAIPAAASLPYKVQVLILKKSWPELFVLGLAKYSTALSLTTLLPTLVDHLNSLLRERVSSGGLNRSLDLPQPEITVSDYSDERIAEIISMLGRLQQYISSIDQLRITEREHAHLRALCLFSPDGSPDFLMRKLQEYQTRVLRSLKNRASGDEERASHLVLQLAPLKGFTPSFIEDVFFVGFLGDVSIDDTVPYLLNQP